MATEKEAHKAREQHYNMLEKLGAHSIGVDEIGKKGSGEFAVIVMVEKISKAFPAELLLPAGKKKIKVPLKVNISKKFMAE